MWNCIFFRIFLSYFLQYTTLHKAFFVRPAQTCILLHVAASWGVGRIQADQSISPSLSPEWRAVVVARSWVSVSHSPKIKCWVILRTCHSGPELLVSNLVRHRSLISQNDFNLVTYLRVDFRFAQEDFLNLFTWLVLPLLVTKNPRRRRS